MSVGDLHWGNILLLGSGQLSDVDYVRTFTPVCRLDITSVVLGMVVKYDMKCSKLDYFTALLTKMVITVYTRMTARFDSLR